MTATIHARLVSVLAVSVMVCLAPTARAQVTAADYARAMAMRDLYQNAAPGMAEPATSTSSSEIWSV